MNIEASPMQQMKKKIENYLKIKMPEVDDKTISSKITDLNPSGYDLNSIYDQTVSDIVKRNSSNLRVSRNSRSTVSMESSMVREEPTKKNLKPEQSSLEKNSQYIESRIQSTELKNHFFDSIYLFSDAGLNDPNNEDRITAMINIKKPISQKVKYWPNCSIFGIFDGANGHDCSEYLSNNLISHIINDISFLLNTEECIKRSIAIIDNMYVKEIVDIKKRKKIPLSSLVIGTFIQEELFIACAGLCNALVSANGGQKTIVIYDDIITLEELVRKKYEHKSKLFQVSDQKGFEDYILKSRLHEKPLLNFLESQEKMAQKNLSNNEGYKLKYIGNFSNKFIQNNQKSNQNFYDEVELKHLKISKFSDFVLFSSEGLYTKLKSDDILKIIYLNLSSIEELITFKEFCINIITKIVMRAFQLKCKENISIIFIPFKNMKLQFENKIEKLKQKNLLANMEVNLTYKKPFQSKKKKRQNSCLDIKKGDLY